MTRIVCWSFMVLIAGVSLMPGVAFGQAPAAGGSAELVSALAKEMRSSTKQAEGAAGSIFRLAKTRLSPEDFGKVSAAVPGMDALLKAAPALDAKASGGAALAQAVGGGDAAGLAGVTSSFKKLHLKPEMVKKAVPVVTDFVGKKGGADLRKLLADALI